MIPQGTLKPSYVLDGQIVPSGKSQPHHQMPAELCRLGLAQLQGSASQCEEGQQNLRSIG